MSELSVALMLVIGSLREIDESPAYVAVFKQLLPVHIGLTVLKYLLIDGDNLELEEVVPGISGEKRGDGRQSLSLNECLIQGFLVQLQHK